jgi:hypothetical protein
LYFVCKNKDDFTFLYFIGDTLMFRDFLNVDNSPVFALSKKGLAKTVLLTTVVLATVSISTGVVPLTVAGVSNTQPADAGIPTYSEFKVIWNDVPGFYRQINEGRIRQYFFASYDGNYIQRQYGSSADAVLHRWCSNTYSDRYIRPTNDGGLYWGFWGGNRYFLVVSRFENGRGNCYARGF